MQSSTCSICIALGAEVTASRQVGNNEFKDEFLPREADFLESSTSLKIVHQQSSEKWGALAGSIVEEQIRRCPQCGTLYVFTRSTYSHVHFADIIEKLTRKQDGL